MARLFGLVSDRPVDFRFSLAEAPARFQAHGQNNPDGWGLGYFREGRAEVRKSALPAQGELPPDEAGTQATSDLFVAHVRRSSRAPRAWKNTHPFTEKGWLFAHTGALYPRLEARVRREAGRAPYEGQTDSEALFRLLLLKLDSHPDPAQAIRAALAPLLEDGQFSGLNFLLARQGALYAFRYAARSAGYYSLYWQQRGPGAPLQARSSDNFAVLESQGLAAASAVLVCSERLAGPGEWRPLEMGELLAVEAGAPPRVDRIPLFTSETRA